MPEEMCCSHVLHVRLFVKYQGSRRPALPCKPLFPVAPHRADLLARNHHLRQEGIYHCRVKTNNRQQTGTTDTVVKSRHFSGLVLGFVFSRQPAATLGEAKGVDSGNVQQSRRSKIVVVRQHANSQGLQTPEFERGTHKDCAGIIQSVSVKHAYFQCCLLLQRKAARGTPPVPIDVSVKRSQRSNERDYWRGDGGWEPGIKSLRPHPSAGLRGAWSPSRQEETVNIL